MTIPNGKTVGKSSKLCHVHPLFTMFRHIWKTLTNSLNRGRCTLSEHNQTGNDKTDAALHY